jgi:hypothetical protein
MDVGAAHPDATMLTCDCGARFEVEDTLAGQEVACPECQQPVKVPARHKVPLRTSGYALASVVVALVGAFTPAALVAIGLGVAGLVSIRRHRERLTGAGFAVFGIVLGVVFSTLTGLALVLGFTGLGGYIRERTLATQIDRTGPLKVTDPGAGFEITRPSEKWGKTSVPHLDDVIVDHFQSGRELVLVQPSHYAVVDVQVERGAFQPLERWRDDVLAEFNPQRQVPPGRPHRFDDDEDIPLNMRAKLLESRRLEETDREGLETVLDVRVFGQQWRFLIRLYRKGNGPVYVVRAYTQARHFAAREAELRQALDSFRILGGR